MSSSMAVTIAPRQQLHTVASVVGQMGAQVHHSLEVAVQSPTTGNESAALLSTPENT